MIYPLCICKRPFFELFLFFTGIPKLLSDPPRQISVSENSVINVKHLLAGGQWLSLVVEWQFREYAHLHIPVSKMVYPAVYIAEHQTKKVDRTFCGKKLRVKAWSRHGTSKWKETIVNVKCKDQFIFTPNSRAIMRRTSGFGQIWVVGFRGSENLLNTYLVICEPLKAPGPLVTAL